MARNPRLFVSFDFDRDRVLRDLSSGRLALPGSPLRSGRLVNEGSRARAELGSEAERRINRCDFVLVMVKPETYRAPGVLKEGAIARRLGKLVGQMIGYKDSSPRRVENAGRLYRWNWENLKKLLPRVQ